MTDRKINIFPHCTVWKFCHSEYLYFEGRSTGLPRTPSIVGLNLSWPSLTACSTGSSVCRIFFLISSKGPGLSASWLLRLSASLALFSCLCLSHSEGSTPGLTSWKNVNKQLTKCKQSWQHTQWVNFRIFLPFRFYVISILENLPFFDIFKKNHENQNS